MTILHKYSISKFRWLFSPLLMLVAFACVSCKSDYKPINHSKPESDTLITLIFAGDVMHHLPQMSAAYNPNTNQLDYSPVFQYIQPIIESADLAICNLETILGGEPYTGYPRFSAPDNLLHALGETGFQLFMLANNHIMDRGSVGLERTIQLIQQEKLLSIGAYISPEQRNSNYPLIINLKGLKIAFLNFTYSTNGLPVHKPNVVNMLDTAEIFNDLKALRETENPDIIIAMPHWGYEYHLYSNSEQKEIAKFLVRNGVDAIVGSHPHVVQEVDLMPSESSLVPVYYSLGNFISNQRKKHQNGGILAKIEINNRQKIIQSASVIPFYLFYGAVDSEVNYFLVSTSAYISYPGLIKLPAESTVELIEHHTSVSQRVSKMKIE